jgi:probable phosphomutase (TIGR03848 family)
MAKFILVRHATNDTVGKRIAGRIESVHLNEEGKQQSVHLAGRLKHLPISAIYSSPLERAMETAEPLAGLINLPINQHQGLLEIDFGNWTNKTIDELRSIELFHQFNSLRSCTRIPGGEIMIEAQARMINCIQELNAKHPGEMIALFSHADMIKAAIAYYSGIHLDMLQRIEISPASVSILELFNDNAQVLLLNHTGDL